MSMNTKKKYNILMCTDFTVPKFGGVETHGYELSQCLINMGHKITFVTNMFKNERCGVRHMANGIKIYYLPKLPILNGDASFFALWNIYPVMREIIIREKIDICHGHQSTSLIGTEVMQIGKMMGCKIIFTEHSLFNY